MRVLLLLLIVITVISGVYSTTDVRSWTFDDVIDAGEESKTLTINNAAPGLGVFNIVAGCTKQTSTENSYIQIKLYDTSSLQTEIYQDMTCGDTVIKYSKDVEVTDSSTFGLQVYGKEGVQFQITLKLESIDMTLSDGVASSEGTVEYDTMFIKSFSVTEDQIESSDDWSYIQVSVSSPDQYLDPTKTGTEDKRLVGKLMLTNDRKNMEKFYDNGRAALVGALRLSFSTFGRITLSAASSPPLAAGRWYVCVIMDRSWSSEAPSKDVTIDVSIRTDYEYSNKIGILFGVSLLGVVIPLVARLIFDAENFDLRKMCFKYWIETIKGWFWSGKKGLTYLTFLLACLLIVSAFQVVHAKYADMQDAGDRDICFYNEKCYRPYGNHYDVSVNGIASNLPFMVQGVILVLYSSVSEAICRSNGHEHFDYSIPYSFGLAFICEGFGSLLYHICPSQIIFQFDTLFMFVISIIMIIAIFEGNAIRERDVKFSVLAKHKTIRIPKVFAFFVGPVYFFNFIGNLIATEGLPVQLITLFYIAFGVWWLGILSWAAYKLNLWPDCANPEHLPTLQAGQEVIEMENEVKSNKISGWFLRHGKMIKGFVFMLYCGLVAAGFVMALLQMVAFSIFILGILIVGQITLTIVFFIPTIWTVLQYFYKLPAQVISNTCSVSRHFFILLGIMFYVLAGCVVVAISLVFFTVFSVTDKSIYPWRSREQNSDCYLNDFYDTHDFWHLFASFALMMMAMVVVQISKPCRDCYLRYMKLNKARIKTVRERANTNVNVIKAAAILKTKAAKNGAKNGDTVDDVTDHVGTENPTYRDNGQEPVVKFDNDSNV